MRSRSCGAIRKPWRVWPSEPLWLSAADLVDINQVHVESTGEPFGLLKPNELDSACARPRNLWAYHDENRLAHLAASLTYGLLANHPFEQGNKRTALAAAIMFIEMNGWQVIVPDNDELADVVTALATGDVEVADFAEFLDANLIEPLRFE